MAEEHVNVNISATDNLSKPARTAARSLEDLGDKSGEAAVKVQALEEQLDDARNAATIAARRIDALERQIKQMGNEAIKSAGKISLLESRLSRMSRTGIHGKKGLAGGLAVGLKLGNMFKLILIPAIFDAVGAVATLGSALGALGSAAIGGLGPLTGLLATYPGYLAAIGQGYGVVALGMEKVKNVMQTLATPINQMKEDIGNALLPGFIKLTEVIRGYIPTVRKALIGTAKVMSGTVGRISGFLDQAGTKSSIGRIMQTNTNIIRSLGKAAIPVMQALLNVMVAAGPMLTRFTQDFAIFMGTVAASSNNQRGLAQFFEKTYEITKGLIKVTADLSMALYNIFKIGAGWGGEMGNALVDITEKFRNWTDTVKGQQAIANWFKTMRPIAEEVGGIFVDLAKALGAVSMDKTLLTTLQTLRNDTLPALTGMLKAASGQFLPSLARIIGTIANIMIEFKAFPVVLDMMATSLEAIATFIQNLPEPLKQALGYMVTMSSLFKFGGMIGFFNLFGPQMADTAKKAGFLKTVFGGLKTAFVGIAGVIGKVFTGVMTLGEGFKALAIGARTALASLATSLAPVLAAAALVGVAIAAYTANKRFDELEVSTKSLNNELLRLGTNDALDKVKASLEAIKAEKKADYERTPLSPSFWTNSDMWADLWNQLNPKQMAQFLNPFDQTYSRPELAWEKRDRFIKEHEDAIRRAAQRNSDLAREVFGPSNKLGGGYGENSPEVRRIQEISEALNGLPGDYSDAVAAAKAYNTINYESKPLIQDVYNSLNTLGDTLATTADRAGAFETAMTALQSIWTGGGKRNALVDSARGLDGLKQSMEGATVSFRKGNVVFKATADNNWALHDSLNQQQMAISNVAIETFKQTDSVNKATKAYKSQYDTLVGRLAKGLDLTTKQAKDLARQYMMTPKELSMRFKTPGFKEWLAEAPRSYQEVRKWIQDRPIEPVIKTPKFETNDKKWRRKSQKRANNAWANRYAAQAGKSTTSTQTTMFQTPGLNQALTGFQSMKEYTQWINQNPAEPQVKTDQLDAALTVATQVRDVMREISDLDFNDSSKKKNERRFGGPVFAGTQYLVGEAGAEAFIGTNGAFQMIGTRGREYRTFPQDGMVIPNHMLPEGELVGAVPVQASVHIGTINATSDIDVVRAVKQGIREAERNARERR